MLFICHYLLLLLLTRALLGSSTTTEWATSKLATVPLALRSPYLNIWIGSSTTQQWPTLWNKQNVGWAGLVRVDGVSYRWQGNEGGANLAQIVPNSIEMSPTRTRFQAVAGQVQLDITFLSPIEPTNWVKQSFPFSYLAIDVSSRDGQKHNVQLYSDITGELLAADFAEEVTFSTTQTPQSIWHSLQRSTPSPFLETAEKPDDGTLYLAARSSQKITWQTGSCGVTRDGFNEGGTLLNKKDPNNTQKIQNIDSWACVALAYDFGNITSTSSPAIWALGLVREPSIRTATATGIQLRSSYFWTKYPSIDLAIDDFLTDFEEATRRAQALDAKIMANGSAISQSYSDLLAFSARPAFGAIDITVARTSRTTLDSSDVKVYMKDVGTSSRSNAVDVLFSAFPAFLYLDVKLASLLLEPLFEFQSSPLYRNNCSASDLGNSYPDIKGNMSESTLAMEASGSMLIMALAYARKSGDGTQCQRYYNLLKNWADYLSINALNNNTFPTSDMSGDVNLALKAIIGVQAMSSINKFLEPQGASPADTYMYSNKAQILIKQWTDLAWKSDHFAATFGEPSSWSLIYSSYADKLLNTTLISDNPGSICTIWYWFLFSLREQYAHTATVDWTMLTAAALSDAAVSDRMIESVHARAVWPKGIKPWPTLYDASKHLGISGYSR
ncbi:hypothetical protein CPB83DRAFT_821241 [Crepidotus variabilis]|uniref:DUF1793-domain-containing protein n=1 Tax=Crepidotus variabilis TaxID=179855 RepID=A0A9P6E6R0_9AGAR|nr:hypothetical protein CPB83DRAFT_821241 [Crepidotus variabilis]